MIFFVYFICGVIADIIWSPIKSISRDAFTKWRLATSSFNTTNITHELIFAIQQNNIDTLESILLDVSNPRSLHYGRYLSFHEVGELIKNEFSTNLVYDWLNKHGAFCERTVYGEYVTCSANVTVWNHLLDANFQFYECEELTLLRSPSVSIPINLRKHIFTIFHASEFPGSKFFSTPYHHEFDENYCDKNPCTTPSVLNRVYNITSNDGRNFGNQSVFETSGQYMSPADLELFQKTFDVPLHKVDQNIGGNSDDDTCKFLGFECGEANLDIQTIMAIAQGVHTTFWSTPKTTTFANWITQVSNMAYPPLVHSVSYGDLESNTDNDLIQAFTNEVIKLGTRGVSVVVSSGDDGVANVKTRQSSGLCGYTPQWPASCPFVTTVGATQGPEESKPEVACSSSNNNTFITSGGGFSEHFFAPDYQKDSVSRFLANSKSNLGPGFNKQGRGYPDVSLIGHLYPTFVGGGQQVKDGTSASTPVMAAILALVNAKRLTIGKSSVGFANPALYSFANDSSIFHDITEGQNNCCAGGWPGSTVVCCSENGFRATPGWDAVTGLGSINVGNLVDKWMKL